MRKQLTVLGVLVGLVGGMAAAQAGDVHWTVSFGVGTGGGFAVGVVRPQPVVVIPPVCPPPVVVQHRPRVQVVVPAPVVMLPPPVVVRQAYCVPHRVVVKHRKVRHAPVVVVAAKHHGYENRGHEQRRAHEHR